MSKPEIYIVTDVESNGPIPGKHSMLSFASVAVDENMDKIGEFETNLERLPGDCEDIDTMKFWRDYPEEYRATRIDTQDPEYAMRNYENWLKSLPGRPIFTAHPAGFDFTFVRWYMVEFCGSRNCLGFSCIDMKTMAMCAMCCKFVKSTKRNMPKSWFGPQKHTHLAIDDARETADIFISMYQEIFGGVDKE